jgi:hypothetical protein
MRKFRAQDGAVYIHKGCTGCEIQCCKNLSLGSVRAACYHLCGDTHWRESEPSRLGHFLRRLWIYRIPHYKEEIKRRVVRWMRKGY